jgi:hypothetical protein
VLVTKLLDHFDSYTRMHIDVNDVRDQLVDMGVQDEIRFHFVKMDARKIRGIIYRYSRRAAAYGNPIFCSEIVISSDMGDEDEYWKRLVAVKELLHVADCTKISAESEDSVNIIFKNFSLPPELRNDLHNGAKITASYLNDRIRIYLALAILIPEGCRGPLRELYTAGQLSVREIADIAKIPERYVPVVMDAGFEKSIATYLDWESSNQDKP